jgi:hypothetical protein
VADCVHVSSLNASLWVRPLHFKRHACAGSQTWPSAPDVALWEKADLPLTSVVLLPVTLSLCCCTFDAGAVLPGACSLLYYCCYPVLVGVTAVPVFSHSLVGDTADIGKLKIGGLCSTNIEALLCADFKALSSPKNLKQAPPQHNHSTCTDQADAVHQSDCPVASTQPLQTQLDSALHQLPAAYVLHGRLSSAE